MLSPAQINETLEIPQHDVATSVKPSEAQFMYDFIQSHGLKRTAEVGFAYGRSCSHIMAATGESHISMDPFQDHYGGLGLKNMEKLGFRDKLDFRPDYSHNVLPELLRDKRSFQFIFVDGDHKFDGEFIDWYYADLLLEDGGYVLLHDTWMRSTRLVMAFIEKNRPDYRKVPTGLRNLAMYQKTGEDKRDGMHFREFYTSRSWLSYRLITWMTTGSDSWFKRMVFRLKEMVK